MSGSPIPRILGSPVPRFPGSIWQPWLAYSPVSCQDTVAMSMVPRFAASTLLQCPRFPGSIWHPQLPDSPIPRFAARALLQCLRFRIASQATTIHARSRFKQVPDSPFTPIPRFTSPRFIPPPSCLLALIMTPSHRYTRWCQGLVRQAQRRLVTHSLATASPAYA